MFFENSGAAAIQEVIQIIKNFHLEERALNAEFNEKFAQCVNKSCESLMQFQGLGREREKVKDTVQVLMMFLDNKAKMYSSTICSQIS